MGKENKLLNFSRTEMHSTANKSTGFKSFNTKAKTAFNSPNVSMFNSPDCSRQNSSQKAAVPIKVGSISANKKFREADEVNEERKKLRTKLTNLINNTNFAACEDFTFKLVYF